MTLPLCVHASDCAKAVDLPKFDRAFEKSRTIGLRQDEQSALKECLTVLFGYGISTATDPNVFQMICTGVEPTSRFELTYRAAPSGLKIENIEVATAQRQREIWSAVADQRDFKPLLFKLPTVVPVYFAGRQHSVIRVLPRLRAELAILLGFEDRHLTEVLAHVRYPVAGPEDSFHEWVVIGPQTFALTFKREGRRIYLTSLNAKYETHPHRYGGRKFMRAAIPTESEK